MAEPSQDFTAAVSQALYDSNGPGSMCGTCWKLNDSKSGNTIVVMGMSIYFLYPSSIPPRGELLFDRKTNAFHLTVTDLCPSGSQNPSCSQTSLTDTNSYGANVNFDLCDDTGAGNALMGANKVTEGWSTGTAEEVDCNQLSGQPTKL